MAQSSIALSLLSEFYPISRENQFRSCRTSPTLTQIASDSYRLPPKLTKICMNLISSPKMIRPFPNFSLSFYLFFACIVLSLSRDSAPSRGRTNLTRVFGRDDLLSLSLFLLFLLFSEICSHDRTYRHFIPLDFAHLLCYLSFHSSYRHFEPRFYYKTKNKTDKEKKF